MKKYGGSALLRTQDAGGTATSGRGGKKVDKKRGSGSADSVSGKPITKRRTPAPKCSTTTPPGTRSGSMKSEKALKEFQITQLVEAEVDQLFVRIGINASAEGTKDTQFEKLLAKVQKRLAPALLEQFLSDDGARDQTQSKPAQALAQPRQKV